MLKIIKNYFKTYADKMGYVDNEDLLKSIEQSLKKRNAHDLNRHLVKMRRQGVLSIFKKMLENRSLSPLVRMNDYRITIIQQGGLERIIQVCADIFCVGLCRGVGRI